MTSFQSRELGFYIIGWPSGTGWFLSVHIDVHLARHPADRVPVFVPERFPPLTELVKMWGTSRLWQEVGATPAIGIARDGIVIGELARRGLTAPEVVQLLDDSRQGASPWDRITVVLDALRQAGKGPKIEEFFLPAMELYRHRGRLANTGVSGLFGAAAKTCPPVADATAVAELRPGGFAEQAASYISVCAKSEEMVGVLERADMPPHLRSRRDWIVASIRRRLSKTGGVKPPVRPAAPAPQQ